MEGFGCAITPSHKKAMEVSVLGNGYSQGLGLIRDSNHKWQ